MSEDPVSSAPLPDDPAADPGAVRPMRLGVFEVPGPQVGGTLSWPHPRSAGRSFTSLDHWVDVARLLDDAGFDFLFFADGYGYPVLDGDLSRTSARMGINFPSLEPWFLIPTLARETRRIGFVVTSATGQEHPVQTARRFATLDHLTGGRIGWNVVTGGSQNAVAQLFGHEEMVGHSDRYAMADEYVRLAVRFWEECWDDDALVADPSVPLLVDPDRLHRIEHEGERYRSSGYLSVPPSPQRTPVLFQAGTSASGREFAAQHAEAVFVQATTVGHTAASVADLRRRIAAHGRDPRSVQLLVGVTVTVAATEEAARAQRAEFDALQTDEVVATLYAGNTGIDLLSLDPDRSLEQLRDGDGVVGQIAQSNIDRFLPQDGSPAPTVRQVLDELRGRGTRGFQVTGDGPSVARQLAELVDATDLDGVMLEPVFGLPDLADFVELVVPELRRLGRVPDGPGGPAEVAAGDRGTFRSRMTGGGDHLPAGHHGAGLRERG